MQYYYFFVGSYLFCRFEICHPLSCLWGLLWRDLMLFWFFAFFLFFPFEGKLVFSSYNYKMLLHFVFLTSCLQYCSHGAVFLWPHLLGILNATCVWLFSSSRFGKFSDLFPLNKFSTSLVFISSSYSTPWVLNFCFFNHIVIMFIIFPYWYLSSASHRPCPPPLMFFLMLTASTDEVLTCFLVNFWVFISSTFIVFRSSQFACCVFILCCWLLDSCFFSSVLLMFPLCCLPSLYFFLTHWWIYTRNFESSLGILPTYFNILEFSS